MAEPTHTVLRRIPSVDRLLQEALATAWAADVPQKVIADALRRAAEETRQRLMAGNPEDADPETLRQLILDGARQHVQAAMGPHFRKVINATGIILHTALGRAVLPSKALRQIGEELTGYSLLQADIENGRRSRRDERIEWLLRQLTGAEAATVVNNNAAATSIALNTVAKGREVIVSRGQLVEIGGSFRLPEVMEASGARLVEVGTTNRTHPRDYENAITENTAAILRVHPSNYRIIGFTSEVPLEELVRIAHAHNRILIDDVGAGALIDFSRFGFADEPTLPGSVRAGADIVTSSADKLIGAAQGGLILGRSDLIDAVRKNPLARIVRMGKLSLTALEATLTLFLDESVACREVPTLRMLLRELPAIARQAERIADDLRGCGPAADVSVVDGFSQMGSGSLPEQNLATKLVAVRPRQIKPEVLARRLRRHRPPVFTRVHKQQVLIDPRTLLDDEAPTLVKALVAALQPQG